MHYKQSAALFISLLFIRGTALANSMNVGLGLDSTEGRDTYIDTSIDLPEDRTFGVYAAQSNRKDLAGAEVKSRTLAVNVGANLDDLQFNLEAERWGDPHELSIDSWRTRVQWFFADAAFTVEPQLRFITLDTSLADVRFNSTGLNLGLIVFVTEQLTYQFNYTTYQYSADVTRFQTSQVLQTRLSSTTLQLAGGLQENQIGIGVSYAWSAFDIGANAARGQSAIDQSVGQIYSLYGAWQITEDYSLSTQMGRQSIEGEADTSIYSLSIGMTW